MGDVQAPSEQSVEPQQAMRRRVPAARDFGILVFLVGIFAALSIANSSFRSTSNLTNIVNQMSMQGIAACGATLTIVSGGFDLSQGAVYAFCAIFAVMTVHTFGVFGAFILAVLVGLALGAINGAIVAIGRINSFIATLATSYVFLGFATVITGGNVATTSNQHFQLMNNAYGLTVAAWFFIAVAVILGLLLAYTRFGRGLYAIGGNPEAARLSGINISFYRIAVFALSGACAGAAGIIAASQTGSADPSIGSTLALLAIASTVVGGTSILGGQGAIWRAVVGATILELINNGFVLLNLNPVYEDVVFGFLVLLAVGLDQLLRRRTT